MNRVGVGMSRLHDWADATQEALDLAIQSSGLEKIDWLLVFLTPQHIAQSVEIYEALQFKSGAKYITGCSGSGVLSGLGEIFNAPGMVLMVGQTPNLEILATCKFQELQHSAGVNQQLKEELERFGGQNPLFLFFPDVYQHQPHNFINTLNYIESEPMVYGAGSCDDGSSRLSVQFGTEGVVANGAGGLGFKGIPKFVTGVTQSCKTLGDPMFVTDCEDDLILSLDGTPALEIFSRVASKLEFEDIETAARQLLISFPLDPEEPKFEGEFSMARHLTGIDGKRQGIQVSQVVEQGTVVSFAYRSAISAMDDMDAMLQRMKKESESPPSFGFYFNCAARGEALYGKKDVDIQMIHEHLGDFPLAGMFGGYEMAKVPGGLQLYTYTGVLVLVYLE